MKKLIIALLFFPLAAFADTPFQSAKPVFCSSLVKIVSGLSDKFGESPVWQGQDADSKTTIMLFLNKKTGTWTLIEATSNLACILSTGKNGELPDISPKIST